METGQSYLDRVLPDGGAEMIGDLDGTQRPFVRGPLARFDLVPLAPGARYVGARLKPGVATAVLQIAPGDILGTRVALSDLLPRHAASFERVGAAQTFDEACRTVTRAMAHVASNSVQRNDHALATSALAAIRRTRGQVSLATLARRLGCSERTLHRRVMALIGLSPKVLSRIVRVRHAVKLIAHPERQPLSAIALAAGFADQPHMAREFAVLVGLPPASFRRRTLDLG